MKKVWFFLLGITLFFISLLFDKNIALLFTFRNPVFDFLAVFFESTVISVLIFLVIPFFVLFFKDRRKAIVFAVAFCLVFLFTYSIKYLAMRPRPFMILSLPMIASFAYSFSPFDTSMPSSHASTSFSAFAGLEKILWLKWIYLFLAIIVCLSRLYAGVHYLSDVIAGSILGYFLTSFIFWLDKKYGISRRWNLTV